MSAVHPCARAVGAQPVSHYLVKRAAGRVLLLSFTAARRMLAIHSGFSMSGAWPASLARLWPGLDGSGDVAALENTQMAVVWSH